MKILMVCLGNICRSPLAEGIMRQRVQESGLDWEVDSAGTQGYHVGEAPHRLSQKVARLNGIDISNQQCRKFTREDMIRFDKILVMDRDNYSEVKRIAGELWHEEKVDLILNFTFPRENREVPDPWYGSEQGYHEVYELIKNACDSFILEKKASVTY